MKRTTKTWIIAALVMILLGAGLFGYALLKNNFDFTKFGTVEHEVNTHVITDPFHSIQIDATTANVILLPSEDESCSVVCRELVSERHEVTVENGVLIVRHSVTPKELTDLIGIDIGTKQIAVYLPAAEYATLSVKVNTGSIHAENLSAASLSATVSTGNVTLSGITCGSLTLTGSTGDITLTSVIAADQMTLKRSTGDIRLEACDAAALLIQTTTGDVTCTLRSAKEFTVTSSTGSISIPPSATGGACTVSTTTGDIKIDIQD